MTQLEDQLRKAFRAKASAITPPPPPLELQPRPALDPVTRGGSGRIGTALHRERLIPLAAAVAVLAVVATALAVGSALSARGTRPAIPLQTGVPPYYVALVNNGPPSTQVLPRAVATVRATSTGALIARITPPRPYVSFDAVSGAADDRTFVLRARGPGSAAAPERFFLLHINPSATAAAGRAKLTALPASYISVGSQVMTMALSPDGSSLAAILAGAGLAAPAQLYVYNLDTGTTKIWIRKLCGACGQTTITAAFPNPYQPVAVFLSWTADGKSLAFIPNVYGPQLRLLDLGAAGNNVQSASKPFAIHGVPVLEWQDAYMTPDAKTVFITYQETKGQTTWSELLRFSASTGMVTTVNKVTQTFEGHLTGGGSDLILWSNYNGSQIIVTGAMPGPVFASQHSQSLVGPDSTAGIYRGSHYTPIPWPADVIDAAW
jgi:hypothetical protein